ncbi:MAG: calcium-binding protein [Nocardioidaceae bacterium]
MSRTFIRSLSAVVAVLALLVVPVDAGAKGKQYARAKGHPPMMLGPGDANVHSIGGKAIIRVSRWGYTFIAGKQNTHLTIAFDAEAQRLSYRDTGTKKWLKVPKSCKKEKAKRGIAATCAIPKKFKKGKMFLEVWPRLGNDYVDARTLPAKFRLWALMDAGRDTVLGGAGNDFVNGAFDHDTILGGPGRDFLRAGEAGDYIKGGPGRDKLSCGDGGGDVAIRDKRDFSFYGCESVRNG